MINTGLNIRLVSSGDYEPFGSALPYRGFNTDKYRFGFNGQEKNNEIAEGIYTAEFWEYDSRIGRRWNPDPLTYTWQSTYACFNNNPIYFADPLGLQGNSSTTQGNPTTSNNISDNEKPVIFREGAEVTCTYKKSIWKQIWSSVKKVASNIFVNTTKYLSKADNWMQHNDPFSGETYDPVENIYNTIENKIMGKGEKTHDGGLNLKRTDGKGFGSGKTTDDMTVEDYDVTYGIATDMDIDGPSLLVKGMLLCINISYHIGHLIDKGVDIFDITKNMLKTTKSYDVQNKVVNSGDANSKMIGNMHPTSIGTFNSYTKDSDLVELRKPGDTLRWFKRDKNKNQILIKTKNENSRN